VGRALVRKLLLRGWLGEAVTDTARAPRGGRVGRVLVRKLLLRGYKVTALARPHEGAGAAKPLPPAVEVVAGDVGDFAACYRAVQGVDKARCARGPGPRPAAACRRGGAHCSPDGGDSTACHCVCSSLTRTALDRLTTCSGPGRRASGRAPCGGWPDGRCCRVMLRFAVPASGAAAV